MLFGSNLRRVCTMLDYHDWGKLSSALIYRVYHDGYVMSSALVYRVGLSELLVFTAFVVW